MSWLLSNLFVEVGEGWDGILLWGGRGGGVLMDLVSMVDPIVDFSSASLQPLVLLRA